MTSEEDPDSGLMNTAEEIQSPFSALHPLVSQTERSSRNPMTVLETYSKVQSIEILGRPSNLDSDLRVLTHRDSVGNLSKPPQLIDQMN